MSRLPTRLHKGAAKTFGVSFLYSSQAIPQRSPLLPPFVDRLTMPLIIAMRVEPTEAGGPSNSCRVEPAHMDLHTGKRFAFFADPDGLPPELYEL